MHHLFQKSKNGLGHKLTTSTSLVNTYNEKQYNSFSFTNSENKPRQFRFKPDVDYRLFFLVTDLRGNLVAGKEIIEANSVFFLGAEARNVNTEEANLPTTPSISYLPGFLHPDLFVDFTGGPCLVPADRMCLLGLGNNNESPRT